MSYQNEVRGLTMAEADFKQVKSISQREKDIVYGYLKQIQSLLPSESNSYYTIVQLIQDLILLYSRISIDTKILTDAEQVKLLEMVYNHLDNNKYPRNEWKLLFRGSRDGYHRNNFYSKCDNKSDTICIIQSPEGNVFGGFTSLKWIKVGSSGRSGHEYDELAFVYHLRRKGHVNEEVFPVIQLPTQMQGFSPLNGRYYAIQQDPYGYLSFGGYGTAFFMTSTSCRASYGVCQAYNLGKGQLNDQQYFDPIELEVFQIARVE